MHDWQILGIEPTGDLAVIRRAYAQALRRHRPDTDPEGFQRLREAYERCLETAKSGCLPEIVTQIREDGEEEMSEKPADPYAPLRGTSQAPPEGISEDRTSPDDESILIAAWEAIWSDPVRRMERARWKTFLSNHSWWNLRARKIAEHQILSDFVSDWGCVNKRQIHSEAPHLLDLHFDWWNRQRELARRYVPDFVDELMVRIRKSGISFGDPGQATLRYGGASDGPKEVRLEHWGLNLLRAAASGPGIVVLLMLLRACTSSAHEDHSTSRPLPLLPPIQSPKPLPDWTRPQPDRFQWPVPAQGR